MSKFNKLWNDIKDRCPVTVQNREELEYVFNLIQGFESYLEVGTAEGNSLHVLSGALTEHAKITYVDFGEKHTTPYRDAIVSKLKNVTAVLGNSHDPEVVRKADGKYDVVLIDAGHSFDDVIQDARNYGKMAKKYILFHDINLPPVAEAFAIYQKETGYKSYRISNSETFGYGVMYDL